MCSSLIIRDNLTLAYARALASLASQTFYISSNRQESTPLIDMRQFRDALGLFPTGVCLITLVDAKGHARAMTVNSFSSVSLDPPLVLWSLQKSSEVFELFVEERQYVINMLCADQEELSPFYARSGDHVMPDEHYFAGANGAPVLNNALAYFECELQASHDAGDHVILVGRVSAFDARSGSEPLIFFKGDYHKLTPV